MTEHLPLSAPQRSAEHGFTSSIRSAEHGFTPSMRSANGFTLIELLVALMIFSMLAAAGVVLLRGSVDTQAAVSRHLDALADVQRGIATLDADLAQATQRLSRTRAGLFAPAFYGREPQPDEPLMEFVRGGWANPSNQRHSSLQRVEYWWREGRLERVGYPAVDGAEPPDPATLFENVTDVKLRYRAPRGDWLEEWIPQKADALPVAVEFIITRKGEPPLTLQFLVGAAVGQNRVDEMVPGGGASAP